MGPEPSPRKTFAPVAPELLPFVVSNDTVPAFSGDPGVPMRIPPAIVIGLLFVIMS